MTARLLLGGLLVLGACSPSIVHTEGGSGSGSFRPRPAHPVTVTSEPPLESAPPAPAGLDPDRFDLFEPRAGRPRRSSALLLTEISQLRALLDAAGPSATDRPFILRRLAESESELARSLGPARAHAARAGAIADYERLAREHGRSYPDLPSVLYQTILECARDGDAPGAGRHVLDLVLAAPDSREAALSLVILGDLLREKGASVPDSLPAVVQAYAKGVAGLVPSDPLRPAALLRLARAEDESGDRIAAGKTFLRLRSDHPASPEAAEIPAWVGEAPAR